MSISAGTLNSVSIASTTATLNITPPAVEAAYSLSQVLYKIKGASDFIVGVTYVGSLGVAGNVNQTGLSADTLYEFCVLTADSSSRYSLPSNIIQAMSTSTASENNLFVANAITLLSNCSNFISFIGGSTSAHALLRIHNRELNSLNPNHKLYFPCANVYFDTDNGVQIDTQNFIRNVGIKIQFLQEVEAEKDRDEPAIATAFMNTIGKIVEEIQLLQGVDSYLCVKSISLDREPTFGNLTQLDEEQETKTDLITTSITLQAGH